tara:strand:+ start:301 stop:525 length:225 start_codon:yes stop_codon:yes gene_type:complete
MTDLSKLNFAELKIDYAELIVDGMDIENLRQFATENITESLSNRSFNEIKEDITNEFGEETLEELITNNTNTED